MVESKPERILIVGDAGGAHLGGSLHRAAVSLRIASQLVERGSAYDAPRVVQKFFWHFRDRRPPRILGYNEVLKGLARSLRPDTLIATGVVPVLASTIRGLRDEGVSAINFSTDDPFNPGMRAEWFLESLTAYDAVFTPRHANIGDLKRLGCESVAYLPFAYDPYLWLSAGDEAGPEPSSDEIVFVGGADEDRRRFFSEFQSSGAPIALCGAYWDKDPRFARYARGIMDPKSIRALTRRAAVNICLVRRANRDGHVMRTFEIPAIGGFMVAEDTPDHRKILGGEGDGVLYFTSPGEAAEKVRWAMGHPEARREMARRAHVRVLGMENTYTDRLRFMLQYQSTA